MSGQHILLIDDDQAQLRLMGRWLEREGWSVQGCTNPEQAREALSAALPDAVVLDLYLDDANGLDLLDHIQERHPGIPVVMVTTETSTAIVVEAMRRGAYDYLTKPMARTKVITTLRNALEKAALTGELRSMQREASGGGFGEMLGNSPPMTALFRQLDRVAPSEVTVLIQGESGTGKELVARAIHDGSGRSDEPFIALNCAAIPEALQESELFGHEKGAFTGAERRRIGRFEQADGGTLFLDEVGELSGTLQAKLLRVLQERRLYRVGGNEEIPVDVRILAATHKDLQAAVAQGNFRDDLFYRLAVLELNLPPLRDRGDDILDLAKQFLKTSGRALMLSSETRALLLRHEWPGNVRELRNAMERAAVVCEGDIVHPEDLPPRVRTASPSSTLKPIESMEREAIIKAIEDSGGNLTEAMRRVGIPRTTFYRKLKKLGIQT